MSYSGAAFRPRTPPFYTSQTRNLSATNQQWSLWLCTEHLMDMFPSFLIRRPLIFVKCPIFHSAWRFSASNFTSRNATLFIFFKTLNTIYSLMYVLNSLLKEFYLRILINFKNWALARPFLSNVVHAYYYKNNYSDN